MAIDDGKDLFPTGFNKPIDLFLIFRLQASQSGLYSFLYLVFPAGYITVPAVPVEFVFPLKILPQKLNLETPDPVGKYQNLVLAQVQNQKENKEKRKKGCHDKNNLERRIQGKFVGVNKHADLSVFRCGSFGIGRKEIEAAVILTAPDLSPFTISVGPGKIVPDSSIAAEDKTAVDNLKIFRGIKGSRPAEGPFEIPSAHIPESGSPLTSVGVKSRDRIDKLSGIGLKNQAAFIINRKIDKPALIFGHVAVNSFILTCPLRILRKGAEMDFPLIVNKSKAHNTAIGVPKSLDKITD